MSESNGNQSSPPRAPTTKEHLVLGVEMQLGEHLYTVPPMLLKDLSATVREGLLQKLSGIQKRVAEGEEDAALFDDGFNALVTLTHRSLKRNYPEITTEQIEDLLDVGNAEQVMETVLTANRINRRSDPTTGAADGPSTPQAT